MKLRILGASKYSSRRGIEFLSVNTSYGAIIFSTKLTKTLGLIEPKLISFCFDEDSESKDTLYVRIHTETDTDTEFAFEARKFQSTFKINSKKLSIAISEHLNLSGYFKLRFLGSEIIENKGYFKFKTLNK